jgi:hypothetical protein
MLLEKAIRVRVERMLSGDIRPHEVALIFADLRFLKNCPGPRSSRKGHLLLKRKRLANNTVDDNAQLEL